MRILVLIFLLPLIAAGQIPLNIFGPLLKTYFEATSLNTPCFRDIKKAYTDVLIAALTAQKCRTLDCFFEERIANASYAMKMLASIGRPHSLDLDELSLTWAGDTQLCRKVEACYIFFSGPFPTKYCFAHIHIDWRRVDLANYGFDLTAHLPGGKIPDVEDGSTTDASCSRMMGVSNARIAFCLPASCENDKDLGRILSQATNGTARLCEIACEGAKKKDMFLYLFNAILITLLSTAIISSFLDYWATRSTKNEELKDSASWRVVMAFSIPRNTTSIFSLRKDSQSIACLGAIRFVSFTWVAALHSDVFAADGDNGLQYLRESDYFFSSIFLNAYPSVDTFFLISGLLVSYSFFKKMHVNPSSAHDTVYWIKYYVHRWIRLTPAYLLFIAFYIAWTPQLHGAWAISTAQNSTLFVENCLSNWWMNALYISNFVDVTTMCYPISWFLAVDMQLYWIAPIFLIAIFYSRNSGIITMVGGALLSFGTIIFLTAHYDLPVMTTTAKSVGNLSYTNLIYMKPWTRLTPYLVGIFCGYVIVQGRNEAISIRKQKLWTIILGWLISTILALTVVFSVYDYVRGTADWSIATRSLYSCFARVGWSVAVGFVILACTFGWAGPVSSILSHPLWHPLGRLSYCAFLCHWFMIHLLMNGGDQPAHFVSLWHTYLIVTLPVVFLSYVFAYVWSCLVELPCAHIEGIVLERIAQRGLTDEKAEPQHVSTNGTVPL